MVAGMMERRDKDKRMVIHDKGGWKSRDEMICWWFGEASDDYEKLTYL